MSILIDCKHGKFCQWIAWIGLLILIDQISKAIIRTTLLPGNHLSLIDNILFITFISNYSGFSWFMPELSKWFGLLLLALCLIILVLAFPVYDFYTRTEQASKWAWIALVTISAGIAGNLLDGIFVPYTTDFIQVFRSPSANFTDLFSYVGLFAIVVEFSIQWKRKKPHWHGFRHFLAQRIYVCHSFIAFIQEYFVRKH